MILTPGQLVKLKTPPTVQVYKPPYKVGDVFRVIREEGPLGIDREMAYCLESLQTFNNVYWWGWRFEPLDERPLDEQVKELLG
jgi:hypothetical protein